jgi:glycosyltransferase involved in cell wall biosynthesis
LFNVEASKNLEKLIIDYKPDVAHVHIFYAELSVSILKALKKLNIPVIHTVHDYRLLCPVSNFIDKNGNICELCKDKHFIHCFNKKCSEGNLGQSAMVMLEAYFWKYFVNPIDYIDHFIFVSNYSKNKHLAFNEDFRTKCSQIYNFTNFSAPNDLVNKGDYFLFFGRLSAEKGVENLLKAFSTVKNCKLKIAGTGTLKGVVEKASSDNPNIEYVGFKTGKELELLIRNSSFIIVPSICYENNPMAIIEAFCSGKPVIGADIGGISELITHSGNGYLFKPDDSESLASIIEKAAKLSDSEYIHYSVASKKSAQDKFDSEKHYQKLLNIYQDIVKKYSN